MFVATVMMSEVSNAASLGQRIYINQSSRIYPPVEAPAGRYTEQAEHPGEGHMVIIVRTMMIISIYFFGLISYNVPQHRSRRTH
jgi:hypothetical protein